MAGIDSSLAEEVIIERKNVLHARVNVDESRRVRLIVPSDFTERDIEKLTLKKGKWINNNLRFFLTRIQKTIKLAKKEVLFLGEPFSFEYVPSLADDNIDFKSRRILTSLNLANESELLRWYRQKAQDCIIKRVQYLSQKSHFNYKKIFIRAQRTKWGNFSKKKNLSFNWRLVKAPQFVLDYIIFHELIHTEIFNHSRLFWLKISFLMPRYKDAIGWLNAYGKSLY